MTCSNCEIQLETSANLMGIGFLFRENEIQEHEKISLIEEYFSKNYHHNSWLIGRPLGDCLNSISFLAKKLLPKSLRNMDARKSRIFQLALQLDGPEDVLSEIKKLESGSSELLMVSQFLNFADRADGLRYELAKALVPYVDLTRNGNTLTSLLFEEELEEDAEYIKKWIDSLKRNALRGHDAQSRANNIVAEWVLKVEENPDLLIHLNALKAMNCWNLFKS